MKRFKNFHPEELSNLLPFSYLLNLLLHTKYYDCFKIYPTDSDYICQVYVLGTATRAGDPHVHKELLSFLNKYKGIVLLLDPDVAGRQARNILNKVIPDCWHAFVPSPLAVATQARGYKEVGNIGVEHATPRVIIEALKRRRKGDEGRNEFNKENLYDVGLVAAEFERESCLFKLFIKALDNILG